MLWLATFDWKAARLVSLCAMLESDVEAVVFCAECIVFMSGADFPIQSPSHHSSDISFNVCALCCGLFGCQNLFADICAKINAVLAAYTAFKTVTLSVGLPNSLFVREKIFKDVLGVCVEANTSLKERFKKFLARKMSPESFSIVFNQEFDVEILIQLQAPFLKKGDVDFFVGLVTETGKSNEDLNNGSSKRRKVPSSKREIESIFDEKNLQLLKSQKDAIVPYLMCKLNGQTGNSADSSAFTFSLSVKGRSVFVAGHYLKLERGISQTPWIVGSEKKTPNSVSEIIEEPLKQIFEYTVSKFCSAGREDADVRMMGDGRPFLLELVDAHNFEHFHRLFNEERSIQSLQKMFDGMNFVSKHLVTARNLCVVNGSRAHDILKEGEEEKEKIYRCVVWTDQLVTDEQIASLNLMSNLCITQRTPIRVSQRRAILNREKIVYDMRAIRIDSNHFYLYLKTEAGTYIKEFVHGDLGRTRPSLGCILWGENHCKNPSHLIDIIELDVLCINLPNWPPK